MQLVRFSIGRILMFNYPFHPQVATPSGTVNNKITQAWHPAVIVGEPGNVARPRFRNTLFQVVPATSYKTDHDRWAQNSKLYPLIKSRANGFRNDSLILLDHLMTVDLNYFQLARQVNAAGLGVLNQAEMKVIMDGLQDYHQAQTYGHLSPV